MSNDYFIDVKTWNKLQKQRWIKENKERDEYTRQKWNKENREYYLAYQRAKSEKERQRLAQGQAKFNFSTKGDMFRFKGSSFQLKETPDNVNLPVGLKNKICREKK
jgi:hypothetical protein